MGLHNNINSLLYKSYAIYEYAGRISYYKFNYYKLLELVPADDEVKFVVIYDELIDNTPPKQKTVVFDNLNDAYVLLTELNRRSNYAFNIFIARVDKK